MRATTATALDHLPAQSPLRCRLTCGHAGIDPFRTFGMFVSKNAFRSSVIWASLTALICSRALAALAKGLNATSLASLPNRSMSLRECGAHARTFWGCASGGAGGRCPFHLLVLWQGSRCAPTPRHVVLMVAYPVRRGPQPSCAACKSASMHAAAHARPFAARARAAVASLPTC